MWGDVDHEAGSAMESDEIDEFVLNDDFRIPGYVPALVYVHDHGLRIRNVRRARVASC